LAGYVRDWLEQRDDGPASDLDLVVLLVNSLDVLEDPPDRLTDLVWFRGVTAEVGRADITGKLRGDLTELRQLRRVVAAAFQASSPDIAASILNPMLVRASAVPQLSDIRLPPK
jgi:hypothetical protein